MKLSNAGREMIKGFEDLRLQAYDDKTGKPLKKGDVPQGTPTIGYGHTKGVKPGDTCTKEQADAWLSEDVGIADDTLRIIFPGLVDPLAPNHYDALISFTMNLGSKPFKFGTGIQSALSGRNFQVVPREIKRWHWAGGVPNVTTPRREAEARLFSEGVYPGEPKPAHPLLKRGDKGEAVKELREALDKWMGFRRDTFDAALEATVKHFQGQCGLKPDGIVGPLTRQALEAATKEQP